VEGCVCGKELLTALGLDRLGKKAMKFLFRVPLFDLDPNSESDISEEWDKILNAIAHSSPTLYKEIKKESYSDLAQSLKHKVYKYLLRGRFRSTPFGLWSGVGIGGFDESQSTVLDLSLTEQLTIEAAPEPDGDDRQPLYISLGGVERLGRVHFLSFMPKEQRWVFVSIPRNPLSSLLLTKLSPSKGISFTEFKAWFRDSPHPTIQELWTQLKELGILSDRRKHSNLQVSTRDYVDTVVNEKLTLPPSVKEELNTFFETAGSLFSRVKSIYLTSLTAWFESQFDDRFTPLPLLLEYPDFVFSTFLQSASTISEDDINLNGLLDKGQPVSIDLSKEVLPTPMDDGIFDLGFVFKKSNPTEIIVDNLVCNRPFSLFGRFNRDERIYCYQRELKDKIFQSNAVIYTEVRVFENSAVEGICDTKPLFERYISPFPEYDHRAIQLSDIEIGVRSNRFLLFDKISGKRIIPIVTHPLNGKEISHPLIRLLWELELQDAFKFVPYHSPYFSGRRYIPELRWGNLVLQGRKWIIRVEDFPSKDQLHRWMNQQAIPARIRSGNYDRELILRWQDDKDFEILWSELVKNGRLTIGEAGWLESQEYFSTRQRPIYPEFVVNVNRTKKEDTWNGFINSVTEEDKNSLYILIRIPGDELDDFLDFYFGRDLLDYLSQEKIVWYYLVYPEGERLQIRTRFLKIEGEVKKQLLWLGYGRFSREHLDVELRPYYPEIKKYGRTGYVISEKVFHLESVLMVNRAIDGKHRCLDSNDLLGLVTGIWQKVLEAVFEEAQIFEFVRDRSRRIPFAEKRLLMANVLLTQEDFKGVEPYRSWMDSFHQLMLTQISEGSNESEKWRCISNHLHMQVNRFFPLERRDMENTIYLVLYKVYGRRAYTRCR
jgi:thiopeptide-type bacteriocin biosynthesis protein